MTETPASLGGVLKRGAAMSAIGLAIAQVVMIAQTLVVGRLIGPAEIGVFTAGTVMVGFLTEFGRGALPQALIHRKTDIEDAANTVLVVNVATGLLLGLAILAASPLISMLFHSPRVGLVAAASSGLLLLHVCASVPDALMQRAFQFKRQMIIGPSVAIVFASVSILFAIRGYGAWAMVIGSYASTVTAVIMSWWMAKWKPFRGRFSVRIWREMAKYSFPLFVDGIAGRGHEMAEQMLVGRFLGTASLGQYRYARRFASLPDMAVVDICSHVLFPAFSRISDDAVRFREAFLRALGWIWFAALPIAALMVMMGQPAVVLVLGEEWRPAGAAVAAMAGMGLGTALEAVGWEAIKGAGRSSLLPWLTALRVCLALPLLVLLLPYGLVGVGIAISVTYLVVGFAIVQVGRSVVGASQREILARLWPTTLSAVAGLAVILPLEWYVVRADHWPTTPGIALIAAECVLFVLVYVAALRLISPSWYWSVRGVVGRAVAKVSALILRRVSRSA